MALDALAINCLQEEIKKAITGGRIDKIYQPEKDEIMIHVRTFTENYNLILSASSSHPRIHFTDRKKQNPISAPLFCMLLRKHLVGGKIADVRQVGFERIVILDIQSYDEMGDPALKHLIIEIMGKHSNIILINSDMKIIDCIKRVDITMSSKRQILPGLIYEAPPKQDKTPLNIFSGNLPPLAPSTSVSKALMGVISGISPLTAREIVYDAFKDTNIHTGEISDISPLEKACLKVRDMLIQKNFSPCIIKDENLTKIQDFSAIPIHQYEGLMSIIPQPDMNSLLDSFYAERDALERMKQKTADITKLLNNNLERCYKKKIILSNTLKESENRETYKIWADLINANVYSIKSGAKEVVVPNFYDPEMKEVKINLDPGITPAQNAQRYYKKYTKAKTAAVEAELQLQQNDMNIDYLESVSAAIKNCTTEADINAIRSELASEGYMKAAHRKKGQKEQKSMPLHFISPDGFDIYVGKNNIQNDILTTKFANSSDIWFHTKQIHGSHTIIKLGTDKNVPDTTLMMAAELAAFYSKAGESNQVPVDYTTIKNVKKPNGAKPGMVIYDSYNTVYVKPKNYDPA